MISLWCIHLLIDKPSKPQLKKKTAAHLYPLWHPVIAPETQSAWWTHKSYYGSVRLSATYKWIKICKQLWQLPLYGSRSKTPFLRNGHLVIWNIKIFSKNFFLFPLFGVPKVVLMIYSNMLQGNKVYILKHISFKSLSIQAVNQKSQIILS